MARKKKTNPEETKINVELSDFVKWFYEEIVGSQADATDYIQLHRTIKKLAWSEEGYKTYPVDLFYRAIEYLTDAGVLLDSYTILMWPGLMRAVENEDRLAIRKICDTLRIQNSVEPMFDKQIVNMRPSGY